MYPEGEGKGAFTPRSLPLHLVSFPFNQKGRQVAGLSRLWVSSSTRMMRTGGARTAMPCLENQQPVNDPAWGVPISSVEKVIWRGLMLLCLLCLCLSPGAGAPPDWLRRVHGPPGHHPHHRHRHQPGQEPGRRRHLQQGQGLG